MYADDACIELCCALEKKIRADDTARRIGSKKLGSRRVQERRRWWCWTSSPREEGGVWRRRAIKWHERSVPRIGGQAPIGTDASWKYETPPGRAVHERVPSFGPALFLAFVPLAINEVFTFNGDEDLYVKMVERETDSCVSENSWIKSYWYNEVEFAEGF